MGIIGKVVYDGVDLGDFGVYVASSNTYDAPKKDIDTVQVAGRNGTLTLDNNRFENISLKYKAVITDEFVRNFEGFKAFLFSRKGYKRLETNFEPEYFRLARFTDNIVPKPSLFDVGASLTLNFDCDPRKFLHDGEAKLTLSASGKMYNPTLFEAKPLIRVFGTGKVVINQKQIVITTAGSHTDIDCETYNAYRGSVNCNQYVTIPDDTVLIPGENDIMLVDGVTRIEITPRWWAI